MAGYRIEDGKKIDQVGGWISPCSISGDVSIVLFADGWAWLVMTYEIPLDWGHYKKDSTLAWKDLISQKASEWKLPATLIGAIISVGSGGQANAKGTTGRLGLMQLTRDDANWLSDPAFPGRTPEWGGVPTEMILDPTWNVHHGCKLLRYFLSQKAGDLLLALALFTTGSVTCGVGPGCNSDEPVRLSIPCLAGGQPYLTELVLRNNGLMDAGWVNGAFDLGWTGPSVVPVTPPTPVPVGGNVTVPVPPGTTQTSSGEAANGGGGLVLAVLAALGVVGGIVLVASRGR